MKYFTATKLSENMHETPEGFLLCLAVSIARTGDMLYGEGETPLEAGEDGTITITRTAEEVFRPETIASFEGKPVTITHPKEFVDPENWSKLAKGTVTNVRRGKDDQKDDLVADLLITDKMAIALVKNGLREVSCGYEAQYEQTEEGKGLQSNIIGNHLALVEQGRAGATYAINDHKGESKMGNKLEKIIKRLFGKTKDEATLDQLKAAVAVLDSEGGPDVTKMSDEEKAAEEKKAKDAGAYDELVKICKDLGSKIDAMKPNKDAEGEAAAGSGEKDVPPAKDVSLEDRLAALEQAVSKLLEQKAGDEDGPDESEESADADEEEMEDDDFEESGLTGDAISRAEILAPGIKKSKDMKVKALKSYFETKDGKILLTTLNSGKAPKFEGKEIDKLFLAASEVLKLSRQSELSSTKKNTTDFQSSFETKGYVTAEEMNARNAKHYKLN